MNPVVVKLSLDRGETVKCLATKIQGRRIDVSVLKRSADELIASGSFGPNAHVTIVFQSQALGDSPEIGGVVRQVKLSDAGASLSIEIEDWDRLAKFWGKIERKRSAGLE